MLEMKLLGSIFDTLMNVGVIALIVLFQDEIRRFLLTLGSHRHVSALARLFNGSKKESLKHDDIMPVVMACLNMGEIEEERRSWGLFRDRRPEIYLKE